MQPDALNLAIAQSIEPKPEYGPIDLRSSAVTVAWFYIGLDDWQPRDFINDPSLNLLLLKRLAEEKEEPMLDYEGGWVVFGKTLGWTNSLQRHSEPGPAIAEYYARAKGIYVDDKA